MFSSRTDSVSCLFISCSLLILTVSDEGEHLVPCVHPHPAGERVHLPNTHQERLQEERLDRALPITDRCVNLPSRLCSVNLSVGHTPSNVGGLVTSEHFCQMWERISTITLHKSDLKYRHFLVIFDLVLPFDPNYMKNIRFSSNLITATDYWTTL